LLADVVWPALYLEDRLLTVWAIALGLLVELLFVRYITKRSWRWCAMADVAMNTASSLLGLILLPLAGLAWEFFPGSVIYEILHMGTFNPVTWTATWAMAAMINGALETGVVRFAFRQRIGKRGFWLLCLANAISVGVALCTVFVRPPRL
jgi:hypothetical protein